MRRPWYLRRWIVNAVTVIFLAGTLAPDLAFARAVSAVESGASYEDARESLAIAYRRLKQLRAGMDASPFDPAALAETLGPETRDLYAFVRDRIAYQPYAGTLRFAAGTLMSRAGNACDQALLLGALLTARGQEVRYARAALDEAAAGQLLDAMNQPSPTETRAPLAPRPNGALGEVLAPLGVTVEDLEAERLAAADATRWFLEELSRTFETDFPILAGELAAAGYPLDDAVPTVGPALLTEASDHCWVQVREGEAWLDLDPSLPSFAPGDRFRAADEVVASLQAALMHRLEVRIELEQVTGDVRETRTVLAHDLALDGAVNDLTVMLVPEPGGGGMSASLADPEFTRGYGIVWPALRFNGQTAYGNPFNLEGDEVPSDPELRAIANTGEVIEDLFGGALSNLMGEEAPAPEKARIGTIHAAFTLVAPDGGRRLVVRRLVENRGDEEALRRQILASFDAVLSASRIDGAYLEARLLDHLQANRAYFFAMLAESFGEPVPNREAIYDNRLSGYPFEALELLHTRGAVMDYAAAAYYPGLAAYAATPQFIAERRQVLAGADGTPVFEAGFDILVNAVRGIESDAWMVPGRARAFGVHQGVVDTLLEYLALGGGAIENTHAVLEQARALGDASRLLDVDDFAEVAALPVDPAARAAIGRDIAAGYLVLAPSAPVEIGGRATFGWWRIDPATGETLGMAGDGRGVSTTQKVIQEGIALTLVNAVICGAFSGFSQPGNGWRDFGICMAIATALIPVGFGLYVVASRIARAAVTGFGRWAGGAAIGGAGAAGAAAAGSGAHPTPPPRPSAPPSAGAHPPGTPPPGGAHPPGTPPPGGGHPPGTTSEPPGGLFGGAGQPHGQPPHGPSTPAGGSGSGGSGSGGAGSGGTRPTIEYPTGTPGRPTRPATPPERPATPPPDRPTTPQPDRPQPTIEYPAGTQPERPQPTIEYPPPSAELAQNTGPLQEPWMVRPGEGTRPASARDARPGEPMQLDPNVSETYMYVVKEDGTITYAPQERTPTGRETVKHTDLAENGPARLSGELNWNSERGVWQMDNNSGRYSFEPDPTAGRFYSTRTQENLNAGVELAQNTGTDATIVPAFDSRGHSTRPNPQGGGTQ